MKKSLIALALGTFGLGIAEFSMMAILPFVVQDLGVEIAQGGNFVSAYLFGVGLGATILIAADRLQLKTVLLMLISTVIIGNGISALAQDYTMLLICRFIAGLPHGAFFGAGAIVAKKLADKRNENSAVAVMMTGMMVANLVGVPAATALGTLISWRLVFLAVSGWSILVLLAIWKYVPRLPKEHNSIKVNRFAGFKNIGPWLIFGMTLLGNAAVFGWYSYISPLLINVAGFSAATLPFLMLLSGIGMVVGNIISGKLSDRYTPERIVAYTQGLILITLVGIFFLSPNPLVCMILMVIGIAGFSALTSPEQVVFLHLFKGNEMVGMTMAQFGFTIGGAIGASCSGLALDAGYSFNAPALVGASFAVGGVALSLIFLKKYNRTI